MRQWLAACLRPFSMISIPAMEGSATVPKFLQVLALESRPILAQTLTTVEERGVYTMSVQPYERWCPVAQERSHVSAEAEVFIVEDPTSLDVIQLCGGSRVSAAARCGWQEWDTKPSDTDGCVTCFTPRALAPKVPLGHCQAPVLALLDELARRHFRPKRGKVAHKPTSAAELDARKLPSKRFYFQAVLILDELFRGGLEEMPSDCTQVYYQVLLKGRRPVPLYLPVAEYKKMLRVGASEDVFIELARAVAVAAAPPPLAGGRGVKRPALAEVPDDIVGDEVGTAEDMALEDEGQGDERPVEPAGVEEEAIIGDGVDADADADAAPLPMLRAPAVIEGVAVTRIAGRSDDHYSYHDRLKVTCKNPAHIAVNCSKSRSWVLDQGVFGERACEYYLGAWLRMCDLPAAEHKRRKPTAAEVRAYMESVRAPE